MLLDKSISNRKTRTDRMTNHTWMCKITPIFVTALWNLCSDPSLTTTASLSDTRVRLANHTHTHIFQERKMPNERELGQPLEHEESQKQSGQCKTAIRSTQTWESSTSRENFVRGMSGEHTNNRLNVHHSRRQNRLYIRERRCHGERAFAAKYYGRLLTIYDNTRRENT